MADEGQFRFSTNIEQVRQEIVSSVRGLAADLDAAEHNLTGGGAPAGDNFLSKLADTIGADAERVLREVSEFGKQYRRAIEEAYAPGGGGNQRFQGLGQDFSSGVSRIANQNGRSLVTNAQNALPNGVPGVDYSSATADQLKQATQRGGEAIDQAFRQLVEREAKAVQETLARVGASADIVGFKRDISSPSQGLGNRVFSESYQRQQEQAYHGNLAGAVQNSEQASASKAVTDSTKEQQSAQARLTAATKKAADNKEKEAAGNDEPATPLGNFYKGLLGSGGRKYRGGAQPVDDDNPLNGLFETAGVVAKYEVLGRGLQAVGGLAVSAVSSFAALDQSVREFNEQLGAGNGVSQAYVSNLENIAAAAGQDVTAAFAAAKRGAAAFGTPGDSGSQKAAGTATAGAVAQNTLITGADSDTATSNLISIGDAYGLTANQLTRVNNAVAAAAQTFGSDGKEIQAGLAGLADVGKTSGFSLESLTAIIADVQAKTGEGGDAIASTLTRIFSTLKNPGTSTSLAQSLGIDLSGSVADKINQLGVAYQHMGQSQRDTLEYQVGGAKALRDLLPLLTDQAAQQGAANKATSDQGIAGRVANANLNSLAGQLRVFSAELKKTATDIAQTGILAPLAAIFEAVKIGLGPLDALIQVFDRLPGPIKLVAATLIEGTIAYNGFRAAQAAGLAGGAGGLLRGVSSLGGTLLTNPFQKRLNNEDDASYVTRYTDRSGAIKAGAPADVAGIKARIDAEAAETAATDKTTAAKNADTAATEQVTAAKTPEVAADEAVAAAATAAAEALSGLTEAEAAASERVVETNAAFLARMNAFIAEAEQRARASSAQVVPTGRAGGLAGGARTAEERAGGGLAATAGSEVALRETALARRRAAEAAQRSTAVEPGEYGPGSYYAHSSRYNGPELGSTGSEVALRETALAKRRAAEAAISENDPATIRATLTRLDRNPNVDGFGAQALLGRRQLALPAGTGAAAFGGVLGSPEAKAAEAESIASTTAAAKATDYFSGTLEGLTKVTTDAAEATAASAAATKEAEVGIAAAAQRLGAALTDAAGAALNYARTTSVSEAAGAVGNRARRGLFGTVAQGAEGDILPARAATRAEAIAGRQGIFADGALLGQGSFLSKTGLGAPFGAGRPNIGSEGGAGLGLTALGVGAVAYESYEAFRKGQAQRSAGRQSDNALDSLGGNNADQSQVADKLNAAADALNKSSSGFTGTLTDKPGQLFGGPNVAGEARYDKKVADEITSVAAKRADQSTNQTGYGAFDLSATDGVSNGLKVLAENGLTAKQQLDALGRALDNTATKSGSAAGRLADPTAVANAESDVAQNTVKNLQSDANLFSTETNAPGGGNPLVGVPEELGGHILQGLTLGHVHKGEGRSDTSKLGDALKKIDFSSLQGTLQTDVTQLFTQDGIGAGQPLDKDTKAAFIKQYTALYLAALGPYVKEINDIKDPKVKAELLAQLNNEALRGATTALAANDNSKAAPITKANLQQVIDSVPSLAQKAGQDAATNASLGLDADGNPLNRPNRGDYNSQVPSQAGPEFKQTPIDQQQDANVTGAKEDLSELKKKQAQVEASGAFKALDPAQRKAQLQEFQQEIRAADLAVTTAMQTEIEGMTAFKVAFDSPFDTQKQLSDQLAGLNKEIANTKDPATRRNLEAQRQGVVNQQRNQTIADASSSAVSQIAPQDTTQLAQQAVTDAQNKYNDILARGGKGQQLTDAYTDLQGKKLAFAVQQQQDAASIAQANLAVGDKIGEAFAAADATLASAANQNPAQAAATRRQAAEQRAQARILSAQTYGAQAVSALDPRDAIGIDQAQGATDRLVYNRTPRADIAGRAAALAAIKQNAIQTQQDQLDYAHSIREANLDPNDLVGQANETLKDALAKLHAADPKEKDYGTLLLNVRNAQKGVASAADQTRAATDLAQDDPRNVVQTDRDALKDTNRQLRDYKGSHKDKAYQDLLRQRAEQTQTLSQDTITQADAIEEAGIDSRDTTAEASAKVIEAKRALDGDLPGTAKYAQDLKAFNDSKVSQAQTALDLSNAREESGISPADTVGQASQAVKEATEQLALDLVGSLQYYQDLGKLHDAQYALAQQAAAASEQTANTSDLLSIDTTDPVAVAQEKIREAQRKLADDKKLGATQGQIQQDELDVRSAENAAQKAQYEQILSDAQTNLSLHRISGAAYLQQLEAQAANLKATGLGTRQLLDEYNETEQAIQSANQQYQGEFNIGSITKPTIFQERRVAQNNGIDISAQGDTTGSNVFGASQSPLATAATQQLQPLILAVKQINTAAAVDQLATLQAAIDVLSGGATAASSASPGGAVGGATAVTNHTTINGADFAQVVSYLSTVLGTQAINTRTVTSARKVN